MSEGNIQTVVIGAVFGIVGMVVGSVVTGLLTLYSDKEKLRINSAFESYKFDTVKLPVEFLDVKQLIDQMQNLSTLKPETIRKLADVIREHPGCGSVLSELCRPAAVKEILIMREEIDSGYASPEDIDVVLRDKYFKAQAAIEKLAQ